MREALIGYTGFTMTNLPGQLNGFNLNPLSWRLEASLRKFMLSCTRGIMERVAFLGCSRGLGRAVCHQMNREARPDFSLLVSRKKEDLKSLAFEIGGESQVVPMDFSKESNVFSLLEMIKKQKIKRLFYFAGGGPYGSFVSKEWKDHQWAFQVNFLTPAFLLHQLLGENSLEQMVFVGSMIVDNKPDPLTTSYSCSKQALHFLVTSVTGESPEKDLRLFRPGYMDTDLIPPRASVRQDGTGLLDPKETARQFVSWVQDPQGDRILDIK